MNIRNIFYKSKKNRGNNNYIEIEEAKEIINNNSNSILFDVRSVQEYKEGHLQGAINIPIYELDIKYKKKLKEKDAIIIVYCQGERRSKKAINILEMKGFTNLYHLKMN